MRNNKGSIYETILKASRKAAAIITVAAVIGFSFASCGDKYEEDDDPSNLISAGDGSIDFSIAKIFYFVDHTSNNEGSGTIKFTKNGTGTSLSDFFNDEYEVKITNGELQIKLGTPKTDKLFDASECFKGSSVTSGLKLFEISEFRSENSPNYLFRWSWEDEDDKDEFPVFIYANKPGKITSYEEYEFDGYNYVEKVDMDLKQGWNTAISYGFYDKNIMRFVTVTGKTGTKHKWIFGH